MRSSIDHSLKNRFVHPKIKFDPKLFWDYDFTEKDLETEERLIFYISCVLNNGNMQNVREILENLILKLLPRLHLSRTGRNYWEWHFELDSALGKLPQRRREKLLGESQIAWTFPI